MGCCLCQLYVVTDYAYNARGDARIEEESVTPEVSSEQGDSGLGPADETAGEETAPCSTQTCQDDRVAKMLVDMKHDKATDQQQRQLLVTRCKLHGKQAVVMKDNGSCVA